MYTNPPTCKAAPERVQSNWGKWGKWWKVRPEPSKWHCSLSDPLPHRQYYNAPKRVSCPGKYLRLQPLPHNRYAGTTKYGQNERADQNSREEVSKEETDNLSDAEFKTLVIRMLTELVEFHLIVEIRWKNEGYAKRNKGKCTGNQ